MQHARTSNYLSAQYRTAKEEYFEPCTSLLTLGWLTGSFTMHGDNTDMSPRIVCYGLLRN